MLPTPQVLTHWLQDKLRETDHNTLCSHNSIEHDKIDWNDATLPRGIISRLFPLSFKILLVAACLQVSFECRRIVEHGNVMQVRRAKLNDSHFNGGAVRNRQSKGPSQ
jgi:hypothetical protein